MHTVYRRIGAKNAYRPRYQTQWPKHHSQLSCSYMPLQNDLRPSAAKHHNTTHAAAAARNLDAAIPLRSAETESQSAREEHIAVMRQFGPVPRHKISQHMQSSTASTKKRKSHLKPSVPRRAQFETDSAAKRRCNGITQPRTRARANISPQRNLLLPEKTHRFKS